MKKDCWGVYCKIIYYPAYDIHIRNKVKLVLNFVSISTSEIMLLTKK